MAFAGADLEPLTSVLLRLVYQLLVVVIGDQSQRCSQQRTHVPSGSQAAKSTRCQMNRRWAWATGINGSAPCMVKQIPTQIFTE